MEMNGSFTFVEMNRVLAAATSLLGIEVVQIAELQKIAEKKAGWVTLEMRGDSEDAEVLSSVVRDPLHTLTTYVISDVSYQPGCGAFEVAEGRLKDFVSFYLENFGECLFDGDVVMLCPAERVFWFFHHEGLTLEWRLEPSGTTDERMKFGESPQ